jgi:alpha,alpha-trehalase
VVEFSPVRRVDGYLPIEDHGLIGDGTTSALVGRDGAISWMCVPRFDSDPLFTSLLGKENGGSFTIAPRGLVESRQYYHPGTGVLVTEMRGDGGVVRLTDALTLVSGADLTEDAMAARRELLRSVEVLEGEVELLVEVAPRGGAAAVRRRTGGCAFACDSHPGLDLQFRATTSFEGLEGALKLKAGDRVDFFLWWAGRHRTEATPGAADILKGTVEAWRRWIGHLRHRGPRLDMVERSAITLKLMSFFENGAFVAAPTSSLPETIGGVRNWDYRFTWVRDCAFSVYAFYRVGLVREASAFLGWVLDAVERGEKPKVLWNLDGHDAPPEREDPALEGYRRSHPVRWGNAAADQEQHDAYGEIVDAAYQWARHNGEIDQALWDRLRGLVETAQRIWRTPDRGIWEVRSPDKRFTYSTALCQVALARGAWIAEHFGLDGDIALWRAEAQEARRTILEEAWDPKGQALAGYLGGTALDAAVLALPLRRVLAADHPRMVATTEAIRQRLGAGNGLLYRYNPHELHDGLPGDEGAFLLCSFWLVDNLALQGRIEEAHAIFDSLCGRANSTGMLPEQVDPSTGAFLGNFPQAFSHVGLISSSMTLGRVEDRLRK